MFLESIIKLFTEVKIFGSKTKPTWKPVQSGTILATKTALQLQNCVVLEKGYKFSSWWAASHKMPLKTCSQWWGSRTQFPQHWNSKMPWELLPSLNASQGKQHHHMKLMTVNNALQSWIFRCHQHLIILYFQWADRWWYPHFCSWDSKLGINLGGYAVHQWVHQAKSSLWHLCLKV